MKIMLGYFHAKLGGEDISNPQLGMRVYMRIEMIMVLSCKLCHITKLGCWVYDIPDLIHL